MKYEDEKWSALAENLEIFIVIAAMVGILIVTFL